jgi:catechol 2,3-dioxygenase-like lactoylglutathione lyase family enzyme
MSLLDHMTLVVSDLQRSKDFYVRALEPLGAYVIKESCDACGFGRDRKPEFWIRSGTGSFRTPEHLRLITPMHVAFTARDHGEVDAFFKAALEAGGRDHGAPGTRPQHHANYYGAFVLDPDGHNVEAVFHGLHGYPR